MVMAMAQMKNTKDFLLVFLVLACAPAIFEELFFRGMIQQFLVNWSKKPFISILLTSIIFSAVHLSYFGFLPRLALGMVLGYIFYYTKSIWLNILLHLVNNGYIVVALYMASRQGKLQEAIASDSDALPLYVGVIALALIGVLFVILRRVTPAHAQSPTGLSFPQKPIFND
jgi:membrane protease YdiL (CAAX protease family)